MVTIEKLQLGDSLHDLSELSRAFFAEYEESFPEGYTQSKVGSAHVIFLARP
jgi:hypothetical protein